MCSKVWTHTDESDSEGSETSDDIAGYDSPDLMPMMTTVRESEPMMTKFRSPTTKKIRMKTSTRLQSSDGETWIKPSSINE
jgi:hypothetical protein